MSAALAAARKRRAPASAGPEPAAPQTLQAQQNTGGLTLPQVIAVIDSRLTTLEKFVKSQQETPQSTENISIAPSSSELDDVVNEFNSRYTILAEEIENIKNIVLNLQSYTMNVNKTLLEERVHVLSEITPVGFEEKPNMLEQIQEFSVDELNGI